MKKATICYPSGKKIVVEVAGLNDILQHIQRGDLPTDHDLYKEPLQRINHACVFVLVECTGESEHVCYVVPVELESGCAGISGDRIRHIAGEEFGVDVGSLRPYDTRHASDDEKCELAHADLRQECYALDADHKLKY